MANLKEIRIRIESVKSTQQITSAMKLVAASRLRRAQDAILKLRPYAEKLYEILSDLSASVDDIDGAEYTQDRKPEEVLLVVISSNRGLCGTFNSNAIKLAQSAIDGQYRKQYESGNLQLMFLGKKASDYFRRREYPVLDINTEIFTDLSFENASPIAEKLMSDFVNKKFDRIDIIYNKFKNAGVQIPSHERFLPIEQSAELDESKAARDYIYEPEQEVIVRELIPKTLKIQLYKALLDSFAAEHGARMTSMHKATDNAQELLKDLRLTYNKARQAAITNEIIEIVSGANAL